MWGSKDREGACVTVRGSVQFVGAMISDPAVSKTEVSIGRKFPFAQATSP